MAAKTPAPHTPGGPGKYGAFSNFTAPDEKYLFGTGAEIDNRVATGYAGNPAGMPPSFQQIRPGPTGKNANAPAPVAYTGNSKVGNPRKYA